ncbi:hypothetical protein VB738_08130 [Cyanobium gracile UHCC 0139]|uniref:Uncharacterized protein n=1 Tax=Cyanobium gracile UHCC 0139 TaxID=3110308 RepID=A0ABU5RTV1_9CYAN|nr:hypothetical protein [Cyanobium gracile]MEA5391229.1 hypothetical protein [Cyanobium gracile UHCC 0139]
MATILQPKRWHFPVQRLAGDSAPLQVQVWQPRCGPMALELFIRRFLPGDPL